jgi:dihydroneopterin aldolase
MKIFARHGVLPEEKEKGQEFVIDVEMDLVSAPGHDDLSATVDYAEVASEVARVATAKSYDLIETLASDIAVSILQRSLVKNVSVTVRKPEARMPVPVESVGVTVCLARSSRRGDFTGEEGAP